MRFSFLLKLLDFVTRLLQQEASRAAALAAETRADICAVEAQRQALVKQANDTAERVTKELQAQHTELRNRMTQASLLASNLSTLTSIDLTNKDDSYE